MADQSDLIAILKRLRKAWAGSYETTPLRTADWIFAALELEQEGLSIPEIAVELGLEEAVVDRELLMVKHQHGLRQRYLREIGKSLPSESDNTISERPSRSTGYTISDAQIERLVNRYALNYKPPVPSREDVHRAIRKRFLAKQFRTAEAKRQLEADYARYIEILDAEESC